MAQLQALLKIVADVVGEEKVQALGRTLGSVGTTAGAVTGSLKGLAGAAGMSGLAGSMSMLMPLLSVGGLVGMAKSALDAGDKFNDLAQKTGVSVEALARFKKAAATSGTDIDTVAKAAGKLSKGLYEAAQTGKGPASAALNTLGISATDAAGKIRSADSVMLDIATKFKSMPDGVEKTALAMQLFGKSGAEMIPMLNMGGDAIDKMKVKMTTAFAEKADEYSDKLTVLSGKVGALGMDIMVAVLPALDSLATGLTKVVDAFNSVDPSIRNIIVLAAGLAIAWGPVTGAIVGVTSALATIGPAIPAVVAAFTALLTFLGGTFVPAVLALFTGPVGWTILAIAAVVAMAIAFRKPITDFLVWIGGEFMKLAKTFGTWLQPIGQALSSLWAGALKVAGDFFAGVGRLAQGMVRTVRAPFEALGSVIRSVFNGILGAIESGVNGAVNAVNTLISGYNAIPTAPDLPLIPTLAIPRFAEGGVVDRPTLAMVGDGGEREYIIPESKMAAASARYLSGARGGGVVGPSSINITTGPVLQQDGQQWVSMADLERAMRQTESSTLARIRTPAGRRALGVR